MHLNVAADSVGATTAADPAPRPRGRMPEPIMFPDVVSLERERERRESARLQAEQVRMAVEKNRERFYDEGYGDGGRTGLLLGAIVGGLTTGVTGAIVFGLRAWIATL